MLGSGKTLIVNEGLKAARMNMNPTVAGLVLTPMMRLIRHGDSSVRANVWRALQQLDGSGGALEGEWRTELIEAFLGELNLDAVEAALSFIWLDERVVEHLRILLRHLVDKHQMAQSHPVLVRRLLGVEQLRVEFSVDVLIALAEQTSATIAWAVIWSEIQRSGHFFKLPSAQQETLIKSFLESQQPDENVTYAGLRLLEAVAPSLGEGVLVFQHLLGRLLGHGDLQIEFMVLRIFFAIANAENWEKIVGVALEWGGKTSGLEGKMLSLKVLRMALETVIRFRNETEHGEGAGSDQWIERIIDLIPEDAEMSDYELLKAAMPEDLVLQSRRLSRARILMDLIPQADREDKEYQLRRRLLERELNPLPLADDPVARFNQKLFSTDHPMRREQEDAQTPVSPPRQRSEVAAVSILPPDIMADIFTGLNK